MRFADGCHSILTPLFHALAGIRTALSSLLTRQTDRIVASAPLTAMQTPITGCRVTATPPTGVAPQAAARSGLPSHPPTNAAAQPLSAFLDIF